MTTGAEGRGKIEAERDGQQMCILGVPIALYLWPPRKSLHMREVFMVEGIAELGLACGQDGVEGGRGVVGSTWTASHANL